jgi:hypothetical protein
MLCGTSVSPQEITWQPSTIGRLITQDTNLHLHVPTEKCKLCATPVLHGRRIPLLEQRSLPAICRRRSVLSATVARIGRILRHTGIHPVAPQLHSTRLLHAQHSTQGIPSRGPWSPVEAKQNIHSCHSCPRGGTAADPHRDHGSPKKQRLSTSALLATELCSQCGEGKRRHCVIAAPCGAVRCGARARGAVGASPCETASRTTCFWNPAPKARPAVAKMVREQSERALACLSLPHTYTHPPVHHHYPLPPDGQAGRAPARTRTTERQIE